MDTNHNISNTTPFLQHRYTPISDRQSFLREFPDLRTIIASSVVFLTFDIAVNTRSNGDVAVQVPWFNRLRSFPPPNLSRTHAVLRSTTLGKQPLRSCLDRCRYRDRLLFGMVVHGDISCCKYPLSLSNLVRIDKRRRSTSLDKLWRSYTQKETAIE